MQAEQLGKINMSHRLLHTFPPTQLIISLMIAMARSFE